MAKGEQPALSESTDRTRSRGQRKRRAKRQGQPWPELLVSRVPNKRSRGKRHTRDVELLAVGVDERNHQARSKQNCENEHITQATKRESTHIAALAFGRRENSHGHGKHSRAQCYVPRRAPPIYKIQSFKVKLLVVKRAGACEAHWHC